jgi:hypothetical protein
MHEGNKAKALAHFRRGLQLSGKTGFGGGAEESTPGKVTLVSSDDVPFVVDVDVAHMFEVMRELQVDDSEVVPIPGVDGATLGKALEFCEAHVASGANEARDDAYAASVHRDMLFGLVSFADKWNCGMLLRVLARRCVRMMMHEYDSVEALKVAFDIRGEFTREELQEAEGRAAPLLDSLKNEAFECHQAYFQSMQELTFLQALHGGEDRDSARAAKQAMVQKLTNDWFYVAFLARSRCLRENSGVASGLAADLLMLRKNVWYVMHQEFRRISAAATGHMLRISAAATERVLREVIPRVHAGIGREARWQSRGQMGLCTCGTAIDEQQLVEHGYYESETHRTEVETLKRDNFLRAPRALVLRPHSGRGLLRYARLGEFTEADTCPHRGEPWTWAVRASGTFVHE